WRLPDDREAFAGPSIGADAEASAVERREQPVARLRPFAQVSGMFRPPGIDEPGCDRIGVRGVTMPEAAGHAAAFAALRDGGRRDPPWLRGSAPRGLTAPLADTADRDGQLIARERDRQLAVHHGPETEVDIVPEDRGIASARCHRSREAARMGMALDDV